MGFYPPCVRVPDGILTGEWHQEKAMFMQTAWTLKPRHCFQIPFGPQMP
jgi:hypothetical protein